MVVFTSENYTVTAATLGLAVDPTWSTEVSSEIQNA